MDNPIYKVTDTELTSVANAIRAKTGLTASISYPGGFIDSISVLRRKPYSFSDIMKRSSTTYVISEPTTLTSIPDAYFLSCRKLSFECVAFPLCTRIGISAFYACSGITEAVFPMCTEIGSSAFYLCTSLCSISFPMCTSVGSYAFCVCSCLSSVYMPSCTYVGTGAFSGCSTLTSIELPACSMLDQYAFGKCYALSYVSLPVVTTLGTSAFSNCSALTSINLPMCKSVLQGAFISCINLSIVSLPNGSYISNSAFKNCYNLLSLYLMGSSVVKITSNAFESTPISNYTTSTGGVYGSVYVPQSLLASYRFSTYWSNYAARLVGV